MMQFGLIGIGAGAAAALLFASVTSGSMLSIILFYLAPLPIMIAGIGWSHWAALVAALTGAIALGLMFGLVFVFAFLATAGLPAWWLGYLAMLARPAPAGANGGSPAAIEWYPPGRLVVWAAVLAALVVIVAIPNFGTDAESFRAALHDALAAILRLMSETPANAPLVVPGVNDPERLIRFFVIVLPPATAVLATIINCVNLWLAGRVVTFSGLLKRPWPQLSAMRFPPLTVAVMLIAVGLSFLGGMIGIVAGVLAAALLMAFGLLGFAVLHAVTQGVNGRPFMLGSAYAATLLFQGWLMLPLCLLGLLDVLFNLRDRILRWRGRPPPPPS
jgi:hypothetical protein